MSADASQSQDAAPPSADGGVPPPSDAGCVAADAGDAGDAGDAAHDAGCELPDAGDAGDAGDADSVGEAGSE